MSTEARGAPRILCHQSVILVKKKKKPQQTAFRFSYPSPNVSLISTPTCPPLSASQRLLCAPRRREARKKERIGKPQFKHFTVTPRKHCALFVSAREQKARVRACERASEQGSIVVKGRRMVSEANG